MPNEQSYHRKIIHVDMDAFYASVEQRDNPSLKGKPIAVGHPSSLRGVISAASYEARKFGVRSAMSTVQAKRLCPDLQLIQPRFAAYKEVSNQLHSIFSEYTSIVEPLSLDEAFLDVTTNKKGSSSAIAIAKAIKRKINEQLSLTASAGVSFNKLLAKLASDMNKPDGLTIILPGEELQLLEKLPIERIFGIGHATAAKLHSIGVHTGGDMQQLSLSSFTRILGKHGATYYNLCRGIDNRAVDISRERKSVGVERTYEKDLTTKFERIAELYKVAQELSKRLEESEFKGRTLTLKIKLHNFKQLTRSHTSADNFYEFKPILTQAKLLLQQLSLERTSIRLLGLSVSNPSFLDNVEPVQLTINF